MLERDDLNVVGGEDACCAAGEHERRVARGYVDRVAGPDPGVVMGLDDRALGGADAGVIASADAYRVAGVDDVAPRDVELAGAAQRRDSVAPVEYPLQVALREDLLRG